jgi:predicted NBD/HSP70 family sugar kinase
MSLTIGISTAGHVSIGLVDGNKLIASSGEDPAHDRGARDQESMLSLPMEGLIRELAWMVRGLCVEHKVQPGAAGMCFPGIIRSGVVEESPNIKQAKGAQLCVMLSRALEEVGFPGAVSICNDADAIATGIAARRGQMEKLLRVWTLGQGIGFGRYPHSAGPYEGGHTVVSLDPKETYCGCGGRGHLEGIMGHRAMRLRFLDLEPEEIFANAEAGDERCREFEELWHRAMAAASATSVHLEGPGKFFITGSNSRFIKVNLLTQYLQEMIAMSPLQGSVFEVIPFDEELAIIGAAVNALAVS